MGPYQSGEGSDGNEEILHIPQKLQHYWNLMIRLFSVISKTLIAGVVSLCRDGVSVFYSPSWLGKQFKCQLSTEFSPIWPIDRTLSGATTPGQSGPGSNGNEKDTSYSSKVQHFWSLIISLISDTCWRSLTPLQRCSLCILLFQPTGPGM